MTKRRSPLATVMKSVECASLPNGDIRVRPVWRGVTTWNELDGGGPGVQTRLIGAMRLAAMINAHLKGKK